MPLNENTDTLNNHINRQGDASMIKIFSKPNCPFCERAKQYLDNLDIEYNAIDITKNPMDHSFLVREGHRTVPQFYQDDNLLFEGGYNQLVQYSKEQINNMVGEPIDVNQLRVDL
jgi:glutaredoxin